MDKLTYRNYIHFSDGRIIEMKELSPSEKEKIGKLLNEVALKAAGYTECRNEGPQ